jgi:pyrroline-5-carboxylate reductase
MLQDTKICFIGGGAMAGAMIAGITQQELIKPGHITASDPYPAQLDKLAERYQVNTTSSNIAAVKGKDIVVLSIKPQTLGEVGAELQGHLPGHALVLSIIAGATITKISQKLHHFSVIRVMPNTPAQVGKGMSVWTATT